MPLVPIFGAIRIKIGLAKMLQLLSQRLLLRQTTIALLQLLKRVAEHLNDQSLPQNLFQNPLQDLSQNLPERPQNLPKKPRNQLQRLV
jgi:hypothetical protein